MQRFLLLSLYGLIAQLIDGSLGMAYGLTSTTLLLASGIAPAVASASVHLAEVGTTFVSGIAHWKLGNTNWGAVFRLAGPGCVGAFIGAVALSSISAELATTWIAGFLVCLGLYVLARFTLSAGPLQSRLRIARGRYLAPLGFGAGFLDAAGGGGWGPITTPTLLASGQMQPRRVVGTVDTSEFLVALGASAGFLLALDRSTVAAPVVGALLLGGVIAAPIAAWLVRAMHPRILGSCVGGLIVLTNSRTLLTESGVNREARWLVLLGIAAVWAAAVTRATTTIRAERIRNAVPSVGD
mgnify:CR=1 FL=1